jgi:hypothetical protein
MQFAGTCSRFAELRGVNIRGEFFIPHQPDTVILGFPIEPQIAAIKIFGYFLLNGKVEHRMVRDRKSAISIRDEEVLR